MDNRPHEKCIVVNKTAFLEKIVEVGIGIILLVVSTYFDNVGVALAIIAVNIYGIIKARKNIYNLFIMVVIAYSNYSICYANYINPIKSYFVSWSRQDVSHLGMRILLLFSILVVVFLKNDKEINAKQEKSLLLNNKDNMLICAVTIFALIFVLIFGFQRPDIAGERGTPSTFYEYSIILFILGFYYSGKKKSLQYFFTFMMALYALQNFVFGGRITGIQMVICWLLCVNIDKLNLSKKKKAIFIPLGIVFVIIMVGIGELRSDFSLKSMNFKEIVEGIVNHGGALDTAYSSFFTSLTFLKTLGMVTFKQRLVLMGKWILSLFIGGGVKDSNLATYTSSFYLHYNGGVFPVFGYFYLGFAGVVVFAAIVALWMNVFKKTNSKSSGLLRCETIYVTTTALRWYLYSPSQILRGAMLMALCYGMCFCLHSIMSKKPGETGGLKNAQ